jgi:hypothetical protein
MRLSVYNSDVALAALQENPTQVQRQIDTAGRTVSASTTASSLTFANNGTKVILLRRYYGGAEYDYILWSRDITSNNTTNGLTAPTGRNLYAGVNASGCISGTYTSNGIMPTANNATGNFVAAANGLRRAGWGYGNSMYVQYIIV